MILSNSVKRVFNIGTLCGINLLQETLHMQHINNNFVQVAISDNQRETLQETFDKQ